LKTMKESKMELAKQEQPENFDQILITAIDEALSSLGESAKTSIYFHLEDLFKIKKQEIPSRMCDFSNALEQVFGLGARYLEVLCMKNLHARIVVTGKCSEFAWPLSKQKVPEMTFQEYVCLIRENFENSGCDAEMGVLVNEQEELQY
jgi:hypothetical protein